ncbi:MAG: diguanylate cyclase [Firmicutes bacterium]|nr:diguanylate cyclase [Bacillota bacterium]
MILYGTSRVILLNGFARLEEHDVRRNVARALSALHDRLASLDAVAEDWASWDDTYDFIRDKNTKYIESNLGDHTFSNLGLNVMLYIDSSSRIVFGKGFDLNEGQSIPIPSGLQQYIVPNGPIQSRSTAAHAATGIIVLPEGSMLLAARPILTSEGKGPVRGTLIMGRYFDSAVVQQLAETTHLAITVQQLNGPEVPPDFRAMLTSLSEQESIYVRPLGKEFTAGYALLKDISGKPCLVLKVQVPRSIYTQGRTSVLYFLSSLVMAGLVFGAVVLVFLEKTVLSRLALLSTNVSAIGASGDLSTRVPAAGRDELSDLAGEINRMLEALERYQGELRASEERHRRLSVTDSLTGLHNRTYFEQEMHRLEAEGCTPVGIVLCDIDGLKLVNDTLGHDAGDELLLAAARVLKETSPGTATVARIGGDEFAVLLPGSDETTTERVCSELRDAVDRYNAANPERPLSTSIGFAARSDTSKSMSDLFKEADDNMYREKLHRSRSTRSVIVQTLMKAMEARDFITEGHLDRLESLVARVAAAIGLPERNITDLRLLARFHDIGKVGIPDRILMKPGALTPEEIEEMRLHCEIGLRIAQSVPDLASISDWILKHHEWWNGQGYPLGLKGEEIPLECRILAIVDAYDAMTSDRPYRKALTHEQAVCELKRCAGTQFDPDLVQKVVQILETSGPQAGPDERLAPSTS